MKAKEETVGMMIGSGSTTTKDICRSLAEKGISAIVVQKKETAPTQAEENTYHWSGQPGKDLFFNDWKLLF